MKNNAKTTTFCVIYMVDRVVATHSLKCIVGQARSDRGGVDSGTVFVSNTRGRNDGDSNRRAVTSAAS